MAVPPPVTRRGRSGGRGRAPVVGAAGPGGDAQTPAGVAARPTAKRAGPRRHFKNASQTDARRPAPVRPASPRPPLRDPRMPPPSSGTTALALALAALAPVSARAEPVSFRN